LQQKSDHTLTVNVFNFKRYRLKSNTRSKKAPRLLKYWLA
jgi:hypothetical protein